MERAQGDNLIGHGSILMAATMTANISNYLFHIFMSRYLGPSNYGILNSLLALFMIIAIPMTSIQTLVARYISKYLALNDIAKIIPFLAFTIRQVAILGISFFAIFLISLRTLSSYLNIDELAPVLITGVALFITMFLPIAQGLLQGAQRFWYLSASIAGGTVGRLFVGILLVLLGFGVNGGIAASALASFLSILICLYPIYLFLRELWGTKNRLEINPKEVYGYFTPLFTAFFLFAILTNVDVIIVKHYFSSIEAGYYSAAALIGRAFLFLPAALVMVMFPKVSEMYSRQENSLVLLKKALFFSLIISSCGIVSCLLFPQVIISLLFGEKYLAAKPLIMFFGLSLTPLAMVNILINYHIAREQVSFIFPVMLAAIILFVSLIFFHQSLLQVLFILGLSGFFLFLFLLGIIYREARQEECF